MTETANLSPAELAAMIDHTILAPNASEAEVRRLCAEAREYGFASVCANPVGHPYSPRNLPDPQPYRVSSSDSPLAQLPPRSKPSRRKPPWLPERKK